MKTPSSKDPQAQAETKHTPGPWGAGRTERGGFVASVNAKGYGDVALLYRNSQTSTCKGIDADEAWANARLIAAAPELLEALKAIMDLTAVSTAEAFAKARAAIDKAEGVRP